MLQLRKPLLPEWRYWPAVALAALIGVAVVCGVSSWTAPRSHITNTSKNNDRQQQSVNKHPPVFFTVGAWIRDNHDPIEAVATVLLTVVTGILVWVAHRQFTTTRAQLRAYVMVETVARTVLGPGTIPQGSVRIKNFGQTPAHDVRAIIGMGFAKYPFEGMEWHSKTSSPEAQFGRSLGPSDDFSLPINLSRTITAEQIRAVEAGRWALWINGKIFYRDVFGRGQTTEFGLFTTQITGIGMWAAIDGLNRCT